MNVWLYRAGKAFQGIGLVAMPSAIWVGEWERSERGMIAIFVGSLLVFFLGWLLTRISSH